MGFLLGLSPWMFVIFILLVCGIELCKYCFVQTLTLNFLALKLILLKEKGFQQASKGMLHVVALIKRILNLQL
jgi:hypothetical protein